MKLLSLLVVILLLACGSASAQTQMQLGSIRAEVTAIDKAAGEYNKKTKKIDGVSTEGAEATYYLSGKAVKKIVARVYGETFRATAEFYFSGDDLLFAYQKVSRYNGSIGSDSPPKIARIEEVRLYRSGGRTLRILSGKKALKLGAIEFNEKEYELIEFSDQLKAALEK